MEFALITEGITDQTVIEHILNAHYKDDCDVEVKPIQPLRDATDQSRQDASTFGGWERVLEFISYADELNGLLQANDYLIIHIDSDICWHESIDINHAQNCDELIEEIKELLISKIKQENYQKLKDHIIFAIPIHSTECWLIPLHTKDQHHLREQRNCEHTLRSIGKLKEQKNHDEYRDLAKSFKRKKEIKISTDKHPSLLKFINDLPPPLIE